MNPSSPCDRPPDDEMPRSSPRQERGRSLVTALMLLGVAWLISNESPLIFGRSLNLQPPLPAIESVPLAMEGGDPHIRALMRTISAAESNTAEPYNTLYGGQRVNDLSRHPDLCVEIIAGPNLGDCTTAAGRYQFLTTTWLEIAEAYHPEPPRWYSWWANYSFEPTFQDEVVYQWLSDPAAWGVDIAELLRQDRFEEVLYLLSGTWTSLGYGIEDNANTPYLREIYLSLLEEELLQGPPQGY